VAFSARLKRHALPEEREIPSDEVGTFGRFACLPATAGKRQAGSE
jgi:hypothetical protein